MSLAPRLSRRWVEASRSEPNWAKAAGAFDHGNVHPVFLTQPQLYQALASEPGIHLHADLGQVHVPRGQVGTPQAQLALVQVLEEAFLHAQVENVQALAEEEQGHDHEHQERHEGPTRAEEHVHQNGQHHHRGGQTHHLHHHQGAPQHPLVHPKLPVGVAADAPQGHRRDERQNQQEGGEARQHTAVHAHELIAEKHKEGRARAKYDGEAQH